MQFNAEQQRVIEATGGHHLVLAPPGCGKTAVLAERIVWACQHGISFDDMACLTFTNRAARSMKERIEQRLALLRDESLELRDISQLSPLNSQLSSLNSQLSTLNSHLSSLNTQLSSLNSQLSSLNSHLSSLNSQLSTLNSQLFIGNVHRFCLHYLFDNNMVAEHTAVIDTDTSISIISDYLGEDELHVLDDNRSRQRYSQIINLQHLMYQCCHGYPSELMVHRDTLKPTSLKELCAHFFLSYSQASTIQLYTQSDHYRAEATNLSQDSRLLMEMLYAARQYELYKERNDLLDFEDLLLVTYDALSHHSSARHFSWLQIDEVQDLNPLQMALIDLFTTPDATVVYLGDAQQAIFSFMGAKTDTLAMLRQRCGNNFYNFYQNYRSPQYLLDIFNRYAQWQLGIDPTLLPTTTNTTPRQNGDVMLMEAPTNVDEANMVARLVRKIYDDEPQQTIAVVVAFNSDADEVSSALGQLPHFKISGTDFFSTLPVRLLLAHLGVMHMEHDFIAWSHLLYGLQVYASCSAARQAVRTMMQLAITPADLLQYDNTTYIAEYVKTYEQQDIVIFDTETTGLDVLSDDVVQIAAIRIRKGQVTDSLNLFIETSRPIPAMLGDVVNPLVEEYGRHPHLPPAEALQRFCDFAKDAAIMGHNTTYDYQIMEHNMRRYAPHMSVYALWPSYFDTLKLARLLHPRQPSYKLRDLLVQLHLEGHNSHLADDDIMATLSLATECYERSRSIMGRQMEFLRRHSRMMAQLRRLYSPLYEEARQSLYHPTADTQLSALSHEILRAYHYFLHLNLIPPLPKLDYAIRYIETDLVDTTSEAVHHPLALLLQRHYAELCTLKEADLCGSRSMKERVFVSTVHKAKGLEFDTVIVYDAVDGKYPSVFATQEAIGGEEARKFYVALSRARRRLVVTYCHNAISRWGAWHAKVLTPYMNTLRSQF
ncbi:MAG: UvrD-helicase domain-containing protein [Prevotella sp.]|nr:UvrD-helicase domain-containing protein [Prevotella sp.]